MRSVVETPEVMDAADEASSHWPRFDDAWSAIFWVLSRDPTIGEPLTEGGRIRAFVYDGSVAHGMPTIDLVYDVERERIVLKRVRFRHPSASAGTA